jgi:hypothetical protein
VTGPVLSLAQIALAQHQQRDALNLVRRSCLYWAPETRAAKLLDYLRAYGRPLYDALRALPADEREATGVDQILWRRR